MNHLEPMQRELSLIFHRNQKIGHFEQLCRKCVYFHFQFTWYVQIKLVQIAHIRYFCENSMMAHAALVLNDTSTPQFASIKSSLDCVDFLDNYEVILAK